MKEAKIENIVRRSKAKCDSGALGRAVSEWDCETKNGKRNTAHKHKNLYQEFPLGPIAVVATQVGDGENMAESYMLVRSLSDLRSMCESRGVELDKTLIYKLLQEHTVTVDICIGVSATVSLLRIDPTF